MLLGAQRTQTMNEALDEWLPGTGEWLEGDGERLLMDMRFLSGMIKSDDGRTPVRMY